MKKYTTISGDTWDQIAFSQLNDEKLAGKLIEANMEYVATVIFPAGVTLIIPEIEENQTSLNLPPWKRVSS